MKRKIKIKRLVWPSIFTLLNMFLGFMSISFSFKHGFDNFLIAGWLIFFASIFDGLDGKVARMVHGSSDFGIEIDSLADLISFVIAPAMLSYNYFFYKFGGWGLAISFSFVIFGTIRLARFNVNAHRESLDHFVGMPSPLSALAIISFIMFNIVNFEILQNIYFPLNVIFPTYYITIGYLMVSDIIFRKVNKFSLKKNSKYQKDTIFTILLLLILIVYQEKIMFPAIFVLILMNIIYYWRKNYLSKKEDEIEIDIDENE
ncbi:MAG: CDP-diacylglycerol--serine O-phosphatidyltransferase [Candidatus Marinimicrobia bacterium]|nr:CDP-diacylglycerol--serine O-phosphatidyltransferase [Candidatus Neomarinimicrobiota bacterium]